MQETLKGKQENEEQLQKLAARFTALEVMYKKNVHTQFIYEFVLGCFCK